MFERLKKIPMKKEHLQHLRYSTLYKFRKCYYNFEIILKYDYMIKDILERLRLGKIKKEEYRLFLIAHIKYYYDLDITDKYSAYFRRWYKKKDKYGKI